MKRNRILFVVVALLVAGVVGFFGGTYFRKPPVNSFEECQQAGYPIMESYPEQCQTPDGKHFTRVIPNRKVTMTGRVVCLPHKETGGTHTLECRFGFNPRPGEYYELSDPGMKIVPTLTMDREITIEGNLEPADPSSQYDILGHIQIISFK